MSVRPAALALVLAAIAVMSAGAMPPSARRLHGEAVVIDLHADTILDVASGKRDITVRASTGHIDLVRLREGGVDVQVFALFVHPEFSGQGFRRVTQLIDAFDRLARAHPTRLVPARTVSEIERALRAGRIAIVLSVENGTALDVEAGKRDITVRASTGHIDLIRLREGGVDVQVFALFVHPKFSGQGVRRVTQLIDAFDRLARAHPTRLVPARTVSEIERALRAGRIAIVLSVENGTALDGEVTNVDRLYARGVRMMSLTWNQSNDLADGALEEMHGGLTRLGRRVLARMQERRMVVDVSHLSEKSFWDVLSATTGPIVATHSDAAAVTPHKRNLTDEQLQAIARRGGVVGVNFYPAFTGGPDLRHVLDHVDHLVKVMGVDHVALGSDFDGFSQTVQGLEDVSKLPNLTAGLIERGYQSDDIKKILGGNALRVFRQVWGQ